jgi:hypothetical protein
MNRRITLVGLLVLLVGIALMISPIAIYGALRIDLDFEIGVMGLPIAISIFLLGASAPDPTVTTVSGVFGNPDENFLRKVERRPAFDERLRYEPSPKESTNCRQCYTAIPWNVAECSRCGRRRSCRGCGRPLFLLAGAVRCAPCVRDEVYCNCPKLKKPPAVGTAGRRPMR